MIYNLQAQSGFRRDSMWCGPAAHAVMPSPSERDDWGACTFTLSGQRSNRGAPYGASRGQEVARLMARVSPVNMTPHCYRHHGNLCAEKVRPHRPRQNKGAASLTKAPSAFRKIGEAVNRQGTLTITGSNVHRGTEMPVALSYF
jgi:hypothetical protein